MMARAHRSALLWAATLTVAWVAACENGVNTIPDEVLLQLRVNPVQVTVPLGGTVNLIASVLNSQGQSVNLAQIGQQITWTSSDPSVASVDAGVVTGVSVGTATITAEVDLRKASAVVTVNPDLVISTSVLESAVVGQAYPRQTLAAVGGDGSYTWFLESGTLPSGLTLSGTSGTISGTPTSAGTSSFTIQVRSGDGQTETQALTIEVGYPTLMIATATLSDGTIGSNYAESLSATGGDGMFSWQVSAGSLPSGLTLDGGTGQLSGVPLTVGTADFTVEVLSGDGQADSRDFSLAVNDLPPPMITTTSLPDAAIDVAYAATLTATSGDGTYTWSIVSGSLPAGMNLGPATGQILGTPSSIGTFNFTVRVTSGDGQTNSRDLSIAVRNPPRVTTSAVLPQGLVGVAYSAQLEAAGGDGNYTWRLLAGRMPDGLTLSLSGLISGIPTRPETRELTFNVNSAGQAAVATVTLTITTSTLTITTSSLPSGIVGVPYQQTLSAAAGGGGQTWSIASGMLPDGLSLDGGTGVISGTPTTVETRSFDVEVQSGGQTDTRPLSIAIGTAPPPLIITTGLAGGQIGTAYSQTLSVTGGDGTYAWTVSAGTLPAGLALDGVTGEISGTPTTAETQNFTVEVTSAAQTATRNLSITVSMVFPTPSITTMSLPSGVVGVAYDQTLQAGGGDGNYTWSVSAGSLPDGLALNATTGTISGSPTGSGTVNLTVQVTSAGQTATQALSITTRFPPPVILTTSLPDGGVGNPYNQTLQASDGDGTYFWDLAAGDLPDDLGLTVDTGVIGGTPTTAQSQTFTVRVTSDGQQASREFTILITATNPPPTISTTSLPNGSIGAAYQRTLQAGGGDGTYAWSVVSGSLPPGLSLGASDGMITGTPAGAGNFPFTVRVESDGQSADQPLSITIDAPPPDQVQDLRVVSKSETTVTLRWTEVDDGTGSPSNYALRFGPAPLNWGGAFPTEVTVVGTAIGATLEHTWTGLTPDTNYEFRLVSFRGTLGVDAVFGLLSNVVGARTDAAPIPPVITTTSLPNGSVGASYQQSLTATGGDGSYVWTMQGGSLPSGLALNGVTGVIAGIPTGEETRVFTVQVTSDGQTDTQDLAITIGSTNPPPTITTTSLAGGMVGVSYAQTLQASGGDGVFAWAITIGALPTGFSLDGNTGQISGTPSAAETQNFTVQVTSDGQTASKVFSITVAAGAQPPQITTTSLPGGTVGAPYSQTLQATGGDGTYTWVISAQRLPVGLTLSPTGVISGAPTAAENRSFTVQVTSDGQTDTQDLQIQVVVQSGSAEPVYDPAVHALIIREDFNGFDAVAAENGSNPFTGTYRRGRAAYAGGSGSSDLQAAGTADRAEDDGIITITSDRGGGKAIRQRYGGADGGSDLLIGPLEPDLDAVGDLDGVLPEVAGPYETFFLTMWFRTSPGGDPAASNSASVKGWMLWDGFPRRFEVRPARLRYGGSRWSESRIVAGGGYPENGLTQRDHYKTPDGFPPRWSDFNDGNWHRITFEYHGGNIPDNQKGWRMWLDGAYVFDNVGDIPVANDWYGFGVGKDHTGVNFHSGMRYPYDLPIEGFSVWGNFVNGSAAASTPQFTIDYDDWIAWTIR